ncbi:hypothetical protein L4C33_09430 [Vibrio makurazakiensis]|uniref:hypothetical protein n=1 Tax=Vibrio makurazakiensis TaxID=2910250 RepID=UPI003D12A8AE
MTSQRLNEDIRLGDKVARITQQQKAENLEKYNAEILNIFWEEGITAVTYTRLSKELNITQSTLQGYYPSSGDFSLALKDRLHPVLVKPLTFESEDAFFSSWDEAMKEKTFQHIVELKLRTASLSSPSPIDARGFKKFENLLEEHFGSKHRAILERVLGRSVLLLAQYDE